MSPKKKQKQGRQQALTAEEKAGRVCSAPGCGVPVEGAFTWPDPDDPQKPRSLDACLLDGTTHGAP
jgi:hypothetical protein